MLLWRRKETRAFGHWGLHWDTEILWWAGFFWGGGNGLPALCLSPAPHSPSRSLRSASLTPSFFNFCLLPSPPSFSTPLAYSFCSLLLRWSSLLVSTLLTTLLRMAQRQKWDCGDLLVKVKYLSLSYWPPCLICQMFFFPHYMPLGLLKRSHNIFDLSVLSSPLIQWCLFQKTKLSALKR